MLNTNNQSISMVQMFPKAKPSMTPEQFLYWLRGFVEINKECGAPNIVQWAIIVEHLDKLFVDSKDITTGTIPLDNVFLQNNPPHYCQNCQDPLNMLVC